MTTCPYCNGTHVRSFPEIWSAGTSFGSATGYGVGSNGEAVSVTTTTMSQTVEAARCAPPAKTGLASIILAFIFLTIFLAIETFVIKQGGSIFRPLVDMGWVPYAILLVLAFLIYKAPGIYIQRTMVFPELMRNWRASVKCLGCSGEFFGDGSTVFHWKAGVEDFSWKKFIHQYPALKSTVKFSMLMAMVLLVALVISIQAPVVVIALVILGAGYVNLFVRKNHEA